MTRNQSIKWTLSEVLASSSCYASLVQSVDRYYGRLPNAEEIAQERITLGEKLLALLYTDAAPVVIQFAWDGAARARAWTEALVRREPLNIHDIGTEASDARNLADWATKYYTGEVIPGPPALMEKRWATYVSNLAAQAALGSCQVQFRYYSFFANHEDYWAHLEQEHQWLQEHLLHLIRRHLVDVQEQGNQEVKD